MTFEKCFAGLSGLMCQVAGSYPFFAILIDILISSIHAGIAITTGVHRMEGKIGESKAIVGYIMEYLWSWFAIVIELVSFIFPFFESSLKFSLSELTWHAIAPPGLESRTRRLRMP